ncbi:MAG: ATP-binding protein, partial [Planctomycetes bacterium]|nr:ATP-binding protein [Planctomycetota bacterium]
MIAAAPHEIWVDAATATAARDFTTVAHGTHTFKGMDAAQPVFLVTGRRARTQTRAYDGHMVGRGREVAQLGEAVAPIFRRSFGGLVIVRGEAGMGKSRLVHEFLQTTPFPGPVRHYVLQTDEILRRPLNPLRYWLRSLFEQTEQADEATRKRRFDAVMDALIAAADDEQLAVELARTRSFLGALVDLFWDDSLYSRLEPQL